MLTIYNPFTKRKYFDIEWFDGVFSIFNYITGEYTFEIRYKEQK